MEKHELENTMISLFEEVSIFGLKLVTDEMKLTTLIPTLNLVADGHNLKMGAPKWSLQLCSNEVPFTDRKLLTEMLAEIYPPSKFTDRYYFISWHSQDRELQSVVRPPDFVTVYKYDQ